MRRKRMTLDQYYAPLFAAILGMLGPKKQKEVMEELYKGSLEAYMAPNPTLEILRRRK